MNWKTVFFSVVLAIALTACAPKPVEEPVIEQPIAATPTTPITPIPPPTATVAPAVKIKQNDLIFLEFFAIT